MTNVYTSREGRGKELFSITFRYDINLLVEKLENKAEVMARNQEKFRTLSIGRFQIKDSLEHNPFESGCFSVGPV